MAALQDTRARAKVATRIARLEGNPRLSTILAITKALGLSLTVEPAR